MAVEELVHPPARSKRDTPPVDAVRGFVFLSGLRWMEKHGVVDRFRDLLPEDMRPRMQNLTASEWVPLDESLRVYFACDALGLSQEDQIDLGRAVSHANNNVVVTTLSRLVGKLGATPWLALSHADRVWQRSNRGGAIAVYRVAERIARLEFWQVPLAQSPFFVTSMRGAIAVGLEHFCERVVVTELADQTTKNGFALRAMW
jgi:hypothetical protein